MVASVCYVGKLKPFGYFSAGCCRVNILRKFTFFSVRDADDVALLCRWSLQFVTSCGLLFALLYFSGLNLCLNHEPHGVHTCILCLDLYINICTLYSLESVIPVCQIYLTGKSPAGGLREWPPPPPPPPSPPQPSRSFRHKLLTWGDHEEQRNISRKIGQQKIF